jgi:hypothetical protein
VSIRHIELADYLAIAAEITGLDTNTLIHVTRVDLAESALHAPAAGFGETEFYPDFIDKAAVLLVRLAKNHPLPDGNTDVQHDVRASLVSSDGDSPETATKRPSFMAFKSRHQSGDGGLSR